MKNLHGKYICAAAAVIMIILTLAYPKQSAAGARDGLTLCGTIIIPALFPFCVIALFCLKSGAASAVSKKLTPVTTKLLHLTGEQFCVFLMSFVAGYPVGMRLINELYENGSISKEQSNRMALYCVNAGPAFIISAVGMGILRSRRLGVLLLTVNIISTLLLEIITESRHRPDMAPSVKQDSMSPGDAFVLSTSQAAQSMFGICAWIVLFSSFSSVISALEIPVVFSKIFIYTGEVTTAILAANGNISLISAIISWCGLSVHCQIYSTGKNAAPNYLKFISARLLHAVFSYALTHLLLKVDKSAVQTITNEISFKAAETSFSYAGSLVLFMLCIVLIVSTRNKKSKML